MAVEEYFLDRCNSNVFILWQNENAIVVGKNQNTLAELDLSYVKENDISVVRRLSGGGAMYQDLGNLNFTFICDEKKWFSDFSYFTTPVIEALASLGVELKLSGRNDIMLGDFKVSGNAQAVRNDRILHHGTLLIDSNLGVLSKALTPDKEKIASKGIASVSSRVININAVRNSPLSVSEVICAIQNAVRSKFSNTVLRDITEAEDREIKRIAREKYSTWEWNFGNSPKYTYSNKRRFSAGNVEICLNIVHGVIENVKISGDFFGMHDIAQLEDKLCGVRHNEEELSELFDKIEVENYFMGISREEILSLILS